MRNEIFFSIQECSANLDAGISFSTKRPAEKDRGSKAGLTQGISDKTVLLSAYQNEKGLRGTVLKKAYEEYKPDSERSKPQEDYENNNIEKLLKDCNEPLQQGDDGKYNHGIITFAPHRTGNLGVRDLFLNVPAQDNAKGYFVGAGNEGGGCGCAATGCLLALHE